MKIGIVGTGNIGSALGDGWAARGHDIVYGTRNPEADGDESGPRRVSVPEALAHGEVIVLATPFGAVQEVLSQAGDLSGKIIVDATNMGGNAEQSGAEKIAGWTPGAHVVKSFNQTGWEHLRQPVLEGQRAVTFVAGDDADAKEQVLQLGRDLGLDMIDAGPLTSARLLESLALLWIQLAFRQGMGRNFAFGVLRA